MTEGGNSRGNGHWWTADFGQFAYEDAIKFDSDPRLQILEVVPLPATICTNAVHWFPDRSPKQCEQHRTRRPRPWCATAPTRGELTLRELCDAYLAGYDSRDDSRTKPFAVATSAPHQARRVRADCLMGLRPESVFRPGLRQHRCGLELRPSSRRLRLRRDGWSSQSCDSTLPAEASDHLAFAASHHLALGADSTQAEGFPFRAVRNAGPIEPRHESRNVVCKNLSPRQRHSQCSEPLVRSDS